MAALKASAILLREHGGPEVLKIEETEIGDPGPGEIRIKQTAIGINFSETHTRKRPGGTHSNPLPLILGREAAGIVEAIGPNVEGFEIGQRVAYGLRRQQGAYTECRLIPAFELVAIPDDISDETAAAIMVKGMTACYLVSQTFEVGPGHTVLVQAAAGGVGTILCQWAHHLGATVLGTISSPAKADHAKAHGCDHPINYREEDFSARARELTNGEGVDVVYDPIGAPTWEGSFKSLKRRGLMVNYGWAGGRVTELEPLDLMDMGSLTFTKTALYNYANTRENMLGLANALFDVVSSGAVKIEIGQKFAMKDASLAHEALETGKTVGSTVLIP
ncbi:MAG: quinone oxidoreductase [Rhodospirillaceae bacterium]|jgi:NADPH:quinone reductase|nr:quinone oxidoreductase [Rhodospirillaceae bacterium]MBT4588298.1 quinone oxidoreductase [Rhodospirillaceae bacterium]MBT5941495.1 quinone oxidoreductase [Rhodospirillaceae bacterium]MBT7269236.1 quinone oxidoreductase [Rhodospirillaceae bacterium]